MSDEGNTIEFPHNEESASRIAQKYTWFDFLKWLIWYFVFCGGIPFMIGYVIAAQNLAIDIRSKKTFHLGDDVYKCTLENSFQSGLAR